MNTASQQKKMQELDIILQEGEKLGLNLQEVYKKVAHVQETISDEKIKIVLLSSFSDGKTTIIAALNEQIEDNMKIDSDESSDEIIVYHPQGLAKDFEIMDTPGLFGSKEKEVEGEAIRFSEITERFISEAHIILYVCDAVTPLKESHASFIEKVMRQYNKLPSTIFVINKMDEAGYDLLDEKDFQRGVAIKTENLVKRLKDTIDLTDAEAEELNIVCIAADPKGKGLTKWFERLEDYKKRSHIDDLRACIDCIIGSCDKELLHKSVELATMTDIADMLSQNITAVSQSIGETIKERTIVINDSKSELALLKSDLNNARKLMSDRLNELKNGIFAELDAITMEDLSSFIEQKIGVEENGISFYIFNNEVNQIIRECSEGNNVALHEHAQLIDQKISSMKQFAIDGLKSGTKFIKNIKISGETVKAVRDVVCKSFKFKPWGAIKLASKVNKVMPILGVIMDGAFAWYEQKQDDKRRQEFEKNKKTIKDAINKTIANVFATFSDDEKYIQNYAPSYEHIKQEIESMVSDNNRMLENQEKLDQYNTRIINWLRNNAEDVEYEEVMQ
ncbi:MAG: dynamin family protein [Paludibacteraceae bacterium]|nr:dynamin family protein [Paludibacteraceae bacterium]